MRKTVWIGAALAALAVFALNCAPKPTAKELKGSVSGKASLRLTDGSPISLDDSDEYNPYLVKLSDNYLVLVFGSNRACGGCSGHNIFMTKSVTPYDPYYLPYFNAPVVVTNAGVPINDSQPIKFSAYANSTTVELAVNLHTASGFIRVGSVANPSAPNISPALAAITNTNHDSNSIVGISADGSKLITTDFNMDVYIFDPGSGTTESPFGFNLSFSEAVTQVRFDNSGFNDSYIGLSFGSTYAATQDIYFGPIIDLDVSVASSGLFMSGINTFYGNTAAEDLVLFTANDGFSDDLYVVTSHTSADLWNLAGYFGGDAFLPSAPAPDHWYDFEAAFNCSGSYPLDIVGAWNAISCTMLGQSTPSYDFTNYAEFSGSPEIGLGSQSLGAAFTIAAWVRITPSGCNGAPCTIASNAPSTPATNNGFRWLYDGVSGEIRFLSGDGGSNASAVTGPLNTGVPIDLEDGNWHHLAVAVTPATGFVSLYADGMFVNSTFSTLNFAATPQNLFLGRMSDGSNYFQGRMDNVKIFSSELDPSSIFALFLE